MGAIPLSVRLLKVEADVRSDTAGDRRQLTSMGGELQGVNEMAEICNNILVPTVRPQVGAILHFDSSLEYDDLYEANRHWKLDGSCVLVGPTRALGIVHTVRKQGLHTAFFPGFGFAPIIGIDGEPRYTWGDHLVLLNLEKAVGVPRTCPDHVTKKSIKRALVVGYGAWHRNGRTWSDGIQRSFEVNIGLIGPEKDHNLDLYWHAINNKGWLAGRNNSGGAVISRKCERVVGIVREERDRLVAASRIARLRKLWLARASKNPATGSGPRAFSDRLVRLDDQAGVFVEFSVPGGARGVRVTVSASESIRLQMDLSGGPLTQQGLADLAKRPDGRFLFRALDFASDQERVCVTVVPVVHSDWRPADLQICAGWD